MHANTVLFDLDGTLTDPFEGITKSFQHGLAAFGVQEADMDNLRRIIGPPLMESYQEFYGFSLAQAAQAVAKYRERFSTIGLYENKVYPGIPEMLSKLRKSGLVLAVATSKPEPYAMRILEHFDLKDDFHFVGGSELDGRRSKKGEVIAYVLDHLHKMGLLRPPVIMVGDRKHDILGAKENGISSLGVLFGYGGREELTQSGADFIVDSVKMLEKKLLLFDH